MCCQTTDDPVMIQVCVRGPAVGCENIKRTGVGPTEGGANEWRTAGVANECSALGR